MSHQLTGSVAKYAIFFASSTGIITIMSLSLVQSWTALAAQERERCNLSYLDLERAFPLVKLKTQSRNIDTDRVNSDLLDFCSKVSRSARKAA